MAAPPMVITPTRGAVITARSVVEQGKPRYIIDLVKRVIRVSMETMEIVKSLPAINEL